MPPEGKRLDSRESITGKVFMNPYYNISLEQHFAQSIVDKFNADEALWRKLASSRTLRRKLFRKLTRRQHKTLDLLDYERRRPLDDCVGRDIRESQ